MTTPDIRDLDARAVRASVDVVEEITAVDLSRPTPCAGWTLGDLLAHMTVQHQGFAAAAAGRGADRMSGRPARRALIPWPTTSWRPSLSSRRSRSPA